MSSLPYIAVVSDMDGTFLTPQYTIPDLARDVVHVIRKEKGVPFLLATGRHHTDVLATIGKSNLEGYTLTSSGARAHNPEGMVVLKQDMDPELARELACFALDRTDVTTSVYQEDTWLFNRDTADVKDFYEENIDVFFPVLFDPATHESYEGVFKVYYTTAMPQREQLHVLESEVKAAFGARVNVTFSDPRCMEVVAAGVTKATGLALLLKREIFPQDPRTGEELLKACIAFGDGENDAQMLMAAGRGYVMSNAQRRLLDLIPIGGETHLEMIGSNAENAVAHKLIELYDLHM